MRASSSSEVASLRAASMRACTSSTGAILKVDSSLSGSLSRVFRLFLLICLRWSVSRSITQGMFSFTQDEQFSPSHRTASAPFRGQEEGCRNTPSVSSFDIAHTLVRRVCGGRAAWSAWVQHNLVRVLGLDNGQEYISGHSSGPCETP